MHECDIYSPRKERIRHKILNAAIKSRIYAYGNLDEEYFPFVAKLMLTLGIKWTAKTRAHYWSFAPAKLVVAHTRADVWTAAFISTKYHPLLDVSQFYLNYVTNYIFLYNLAIFTIPFNLNFLSFLLWIARCRNLNQCWLIYCVANVLITTIHREKSERIRIMIPTVTRLNWT